MSYIGRLIHQDNIKPYGIDYDKVNDKIYRIGDKNGHIYLPVQSQMKGVILDDLGNEVMELPQDDWTSVARDGSLGQVMVRVPDHWMKFETRQNDTINRTLLSHVPKKGFIHIPKYYVSAYEASLQRSTNKLSSVVNTTTDYRGGNNNSSWDGTYRSLLGMPVTSISMTKFRKYARNRNNGDTRWNCYTYQIHRDLFWLFAIEYATFNSQADFTDMRTTEGFRKGGLGDGVTTWLATNWRNYNNYFPLIPCGTTDTLGNGTGIVSYTIKDSGGSDLKTFSVPRYHGIENIFGHIWKWTDGVLVNVVSGASGTSAVYACSRPSLFSSTSYSNYRSVGNESRGNNYVKEIHYGEYGDITAKTGKGSANTYFHDLHYTSTGSSSLRGLVFGAGVNYGAQAGLVYSSSEYTPSTANPRNGSRLCYIP